MYNIFLFQSHLMDFLAKQNAESGLIFKLVTANFLWFHRNEVTYHDFSIKILKCLL